jgi:hypothetical protein
MTVQNLKYKYTVKQQGDQVTKVAVRMGLLN